MTIRIHTLDAKVSEPWDAYVASHPRATLYHLSGWKEVIENTYGHRTYYIFAVDENGEPPRHAETQPDPGRIVGVLPLVHMKHFLFGNNLISLPYFDLGGLLADGGEAEEAMIREALRLAERLKTDVIELHHEKSVESLRTLEKFTVETKTHKVRMLLTLPESSEVLMKSFKSKLRSQIKKPMKEGLHAEVGGAELLDDFYQVFAVNMRDLGSPVHSKKLMRNVLARFEEKAKLVLVYKEETPVACSMVIGFRDVLENPWASALRQYSRLSPNMLLYWTMLAHACDNGCRQFDFGRSSPDEGTYKFKKQWGAEPNDLNWQYIRRGRRAAEGPEDEKSKFERAIHYWKKLPVPLTKMIGPRIRKHIRL